MAKNLQEEFIILRSQPTNTKKKKDVDDGAPHEGGRKSGPKKKKQKNHSPTKQRGGEITLNWGKNGDLDEDEFEEIGENPFGSHYKEIATSKVKKNKDADKKKGRLKKNNRRQRDSHQGGVYKNVLY